LIDTCSNELARSTYIDCNIPWEDIGRTLSQNEGLKKWRCTSDKDGKPVYTNSDPATVGTCSQPSMVHPIYFQDDKNLENIPPRWDRRLDTWGNIFYVDHNTSTAQRKHPKYDAAIDICTGLPRGWERSTDQNGVEYFFETATLLATYQGESMKLDNRSMKFALERRPTPGDIPPIKGLEVWEHTVAGVRKEESSLELMVDIVESYPSSTVVDPGTLVQDGNYGTTSAIRRRASF
jgi:hypothetical protein